MSSKKNTTQTSTTMQLIIGMNLSVTFLLHCIFESYFISKYEYFFQRNRNGYLQNEQICLPHLH